MPLLAASIGQRLPDLLAHAHVFLAETFKLEAVKIGLASTLHQPLMTLSASIARFVWEGLALDLVPVLAHGTEGEKCPVIVLVPCTRRSAVLRR